MRKRSRSSKEADANLLNHFELATPELIEQVKRWCEQTGTRFDSERTWTRLDATQFRDALRKKAGRHPR